MAVSLTSDHPASAPDELLARQGASVLPPEILAPIVAGAFARGVVDTFDLLGLPALFLDRQGNVLASGAAAGKVLDLGLQVQAGHLLARDRKDDAAVATFVADALRDPAARPFVHLPACGLSLQAMPVPGRTTRADQLLHAIVAIDDGARPTISGLLRSM
jgi:hypothetical protein